MTINEMIDRLQELKLKVGGDIKLIGYSKTSDIDCDIERIDYITSNETSDLFKRDTLAIHITF